MKMLVVHDDLGNIKSGAMIGSRRNPRAGLRLHRGDLVTEVEAADFGREELRRNPRALSENFRVDTVNAVLVRKQR
jgi:hypothetical protein